MDLEYTDLSCDNKLRQSLVAIHNKVSPFFLHVLLQHDFALTEGVFQYDNIKVVQLDICKLIHNLPPLHLICHIAVRFVLTVLDPACPLSMEGETENDKKIWENYAKNPKNVLISLLTVFVSA